MRFDIDKISTALEKEGTVIPKWVKFEKSLIPNDSGHTQRNHAFKNDTITPYDLISEILNAYNSVKGDDATLETLIGVLQNIGLKSAADSLRKEFKIPVANGAAAGSTNMDDQQMALPTQAQVQTILTNASDDAIADLFLHVYGELHEAITVPQLQNYKAAALSRKVIGANELGSIKTVDEFLMTLLQKSPSQKRDILKHIAIQGENQRIRNAIVVATDANI